jgi:2-oxo-4-hydroxy-4-carboxy-5-ureidoimidazoline decarboxylase
MKIKLSELNRCSPKQFVAVCGPLFEHSPWIAERTKDGRPFARRTDLHRALCMTVDAASADERLLLVRAHPDLASCAPAKGELTDASVSEQSAAGLKNLGSYDAKQFDDLNAAYRAKFGFPFIICVRENKTASILASFAARLNNTYETELRTALDEIDKIAWHRLVDAVDEG